jgi:hypothetical protein
MHLKLDPNSNMEKSQIQIIINPMNWEYCSEHFLKTTMQFVVDSQL